MAGGGGEKVLSPKHHVHIQDCVVYGVGKSVEGVSVGPDDYKVREGSRFISYGAPYKVVPANVLIGNADSKSGLPAFFPEGLFLLFGEVSVVSVISEGLRPSCGLVSLGYLFCRGERFVCKPCLKELLGYALVYFFPPRLEIKVVISFSDSFVPVYAHPVEGLDYHVEALFGIPPVVGVFHPKDQGASGVARFSPVVKGGVNHAHVGNARGRRTKS